MSYGESVVNILRTFIKASRTRNCHLYIMCLHEMVASGHNDYVNSFVLQLGEMVRLQDTHLDVFSKLNRGIFIWRRSDNY